MMRETKEALWDFRMFSQCLKHVDNSSGMKGLQLPFVVVHCPMRVSKCDVQFSTHAVATCWVECVDSYLS